MSSMVSKALVTALTISAALVPGHALAQAGWDQGRSSLVAQTGGISYAISRWEQLTASPQYTFEDYAGFLLSYPGFPDEDKLRANAEARLGYDFVSPERLIAYFDRYPPVTNNGRAQYAVAMMTARPEQAEAAARAAWRGGEMNDSALATIYGNYGGRFTPEDQDARMDALLWQRNAYAAAQQLPYVSPGKASIYAARLAILQGGDGYTADGSATTDPGYLYNRSRELRQEGRNQEAVSMLASHGQLSVKPFDATAWVTEHLTVARLADSNSAVRVAQRATEPFADVNEILTGPYKLRDDYTSLMWLGGTNALWYLNDGNAAASLFYRYGAAAKTPQTRSKGFFWAGRAAAQAGDQGAANRYYEMAAQYPEYFYGLLALDRLGRSAPAYAAAAPVQPTQLQRDAYYASPINQALIALASSGHTWQTKRKFYTAAANQALTEVDLQLVGDAARDLHLPELAVVVGRTAPEKGFTGFTSVGFPVVQTPSGADWTMVHAISRQESEFDDYRVSHAGAQGLMQLMPGTAREQAGKLGVVYMSASLMTDQQYNIQLGDGYFRRMLNTYGSYPLAVAAYNAGPGNVNKWLRQNGDPRNGSIGWVDWIERIPIFETRNYVQRVVENAVVYEALHPELATYGRPRTLSEFLR